MKSFLFQPSLALVLWCLMHVQVIYVSAISLSNMIRKTCNYSEDGNPYVEVTILQTNLKRLGVVSIDSLRLWERGPHCSHHPCCNGGGWVWRFNGSQCGSQHLMHDDYTMISNLLYIERNNSTIRNPQSDMAMIMCDFPSEGSGSGFIDADIKMPRLTWSMYQDYEYLSPPRQSTAIALNTTSPYVGNWAERHFLILIVRPEKELLLYNEDIHVAVYSCSLDLIHENNGSQYMETRSLLRKGCPDNVESTFYGYLDSYSVEKVTVIVDLPQEIGPVNGSDVKFVYVTCTASLCRPDGVKKYEHMPRCPETVYKNCYKKMKSMNPSLSDTFTSRVLMMVDRESTPSTAVPTTSVLNSSASVSTSTTVATKTTTGNSESDKSVVLSPFLVTVVCLLCFVTGCTLIAVPWIIHVHCGHYKAARKANDEAVEQGECTVTRCEVLSLDSCIPGNSSNSPTKSQSPDSGILSDS